VTTIRARKTPTSSNRTEIPSPQQEIPSPAKEVVIIDPVSHDNVSTLSSMSKSKLVNMLLHINQNNRNLSGNQGFAPFKRGFAAHWP